MDKGEMSERRQRKIELMGRDQKFDEKLKFWKKKGLEERVGRTINGWEGKNKFDEKHIQKAGKFWNLNQKEQDIEGIWDTQKRRRQNGKKLQKRG